MEENSQDQDFSKLSIEDRISHKNWKARISGYEELAKLFPQYEDKEFQRYSPLVKKFVIDSNAAAQEKGLAATLAFVDYCPQAGKYVENIIAGIASKCLTSNRAKTKELANDIVMMCVEIEKQDVVVEELIKALDQKTPKNVAATIAMLRKCLNQFGYKVISIKPIVPLLAKLLEERDPSVREEAKQLTFEIYRWIKDALTPQLNSLKPILLQELQVEFEKIKDTKAVPQRLLRSQQQREQVVDEVDESGKPAEENLEEPEADIDPFDLMEPVDIISKLPSDFYTLIEAKKWTERRDGLEKLQQLLEQHPKLVANADYSELIKQLRKIISKDTNIVVATIAIKCLSSLANGLRKNFQHYANPSISIILEKFKEKKANVVQALREAIDSLYLSTNLEAISEDVISALDNKNPSIRSETALFLARSFAKTNPNLINKKLLKSLTTSLIKTLSDSDAVVRESSAEALGTALKAQGDRNMGPFLTDLESLKMAKIEEYRAKVEVKKFASTAPPPAPAKVVKPPPKTKPKIAAPSKQTSNESLNDQPALQSASTATIKVSKPKIGQVKSRLGINSANSEGRSTVRSGSKIGSAPRLTSNKSSSQLTSTSTTSGSNFSNISSGKKQEQDTGPLMNGNIKAKEQRFADEKSMKVLKWNFIAPRDEYFQLLRDQMTTAEWQPILITYCFNSDFKNHIKAIDLMRDFFQKSSAENPVVVANLDLVLKWIALRFFDTNPVVITKALELILIVFGICEQQHQYTLNDLEAGSFIPYLVGKVGDPKDAVRNKVHEILAKMQQIYPANKILAYLFNPGLQSKNARQRATCLEEISQMIEKHGMSLFQPPNSVQLIKDLAKYIAERDNSVRNGALSCIVQVYFLEGERVFKLIGSLSDKEMSLVEERIKRAAKNRPIPSQAMSYIPPKSSHLESALPTLSGGIGSGSRLNNTPETGRGIPQASIGRKLAQAPAEVNSDIQTSKLNSGVNQNYDIGATYSKNRSPSNLLRRDASGGNFIKSSGLARLSKTPTYNNKLTSDMEINSSDDNQNYQSNGNHYDSNNNGGTVAVQENFEYEPNKDDDEMHQKVMDALNLPDIKLVRRYHSGIHLNTSNRSTLDTSNNESMRNGQHKFHNSQIDPDLNQRITMMCNQLSTTELVPAIKASEQLIIALKDEKYWIYLEPKIDQLIILCNKQYRLFLSKHMSQVSDGDSNEQNLEMADTLFRTISNVLNKLFKSPLGKKVSRDTLRELITHLLTFFAENRDNRNVYNSVNVIITVVFNGSDATNLFSALIRLLHDYVGNETVQHSKKFLEITMKFVWRVTKLLNRYIDELNIDQILFESHLFFKSYPRNWWKINNYDDMPLRTIKTLVYHIVDFKGDSILGHFTLIEKTDESELFYYVQKALRQCEKLRANSNVTDSPKSQNQFTIESTKTPSSINSFNSAIASTPVTNLIDKTDEVDISKNCSLKYRPMNTESGKTVQIPTIQNIDDVKAYANSVSKRLDIPELKFKKPKEQMIIQHPDQALESARQRTNKMQHFLNGI